MPGLLDGFTLAYQLLLPADYRTNAACIGNMQALADAGYTGVELNVFEPDRIDPADLKAFLAEYGLRMTAFASGATAKGMGLALSHTDENLRTVSVHQGEKFIDFAASMEADVICGFFKGGPTATEPPLIQSLKELAPHAEARGVNIILEAVNRYETGVCKTVAETLAVVRAVGSDNIKVLADTYHMNIEERDMLAAITDAIPHAVSIHLSDNNRFLPGKGAIDFAPLLRHLIGQGYKGIIALEGNIDESIAADTTKAAAYLRGL